jgi:hypothetical protein
VVAVGLTLKVVELLETAVVVQVLQQAQVRLARLIQVAVVADLTAAALVDQV